MSLQMTKEQLTSLQGLTVIRTSMVTGFLATQYEDGSILLMAGARPYLNTSLEDVPKGIRKQLGWLTEEDRARVEERRGFLLEQDVIIELAQECILNMEKVIAAAVKAKEGDIK